MLRSYVARLHAHGLSETASHTISVAGHDLPRRGCSKVGKLNGLYFTVLKLFSPALRSEWKARLCRLPGRVWTFCVQKGSERDASSRLSVRRSSFGLLQGGKQWQSAQGLARAHLRLFCES